MYLLSHQIDITTPAYNNDTLFELTFIKSLENNDSCNESVLKVKMHYQMHMKKLV